MNHPLNRILALLSLVLLTTSASVVAQERSERRTPDLNFSGAPLEEAILSLAEATDTDVIFDPDLVKGFTVFYRTDNETMEETLTRILQGSNLDYVILSSGTFVIIRTTVDAIRYGSMQGQIFDSETGVPLPNAHILLADASRGASTNRGGHFNLHRLMPGTHTVIFSYLGYKPVELTFTIPSNGVIEPIIELTPEPVQTTPVVITAHHPILPMESSSGESESMQVWQSTQNRSPIQLLQLFPGIQRGESGGTMHLQGSQSGDHRIYLDGAPIYHPYSIGRHMSALSPYAIERISVQKAGYGIEHGSHLAGRIDLTHDYSADPSRTITIQSDPMFVNSKLQLSDPEEDKWALMGAARTSLWNLYADPVLESSMNDWDFVDPLTLGALQGHTTMSPFHTIDQDRDIASHDLHLAGRYHANRYRSHTLSLYLGSNRLSNRILNQSTASIPEDRLLTHERYTWENGMVQTAWSWLLSPRLDWESQWSVSWIRNNSTYSLQDETELTAIESETREPWTFDNSGFTDPARQQKNQNHLTHLTWNQRFRYAANERLDWIAGLETHWMESKFQFNDLYFRASNAGDQMGQATAYTGSEWSPVSQWSIKGGTRFSWLWPSGTVYVEPRLTIQFDRPDARPGPISYKLSGGLYRQFVHSFDLTNPGPSSLVPDATLWSLDTRSRVPLAWHTSFSIRMEPTSSSVLLLENYLKLQRHGWVTSYHRLMADPEAPRDRIDSFAQSTSSQTAGVGIQWRQSLLRNRLHVWAGYDWSWTRIHMPEPFSRRLPASWNIPHQIQMRTLMNIAASHTLIFSWQLRSGEKWGFRNSYYDLLLPHDIDGAGTYRFSSPESDRLPAHHQLDIGWVYQPMILNRLMELRLDLVHITGTRRVLDRSLIPVPVPGNEEPDYRIVERTQTGFYPSLSIQVQL